jgi:hypothetical protein
MVRLSDEEGWQLEKEWGIDEDEIVITFSPGLGRELPPEPEPDDEQEEDDA